MPGPLLKPVNLAFHFEHTLKNVILVRRHRIQRREMALQLADHLVQLVGQFHALLVGIDKPVLGLAKKGTKHGISIEHVADIGFRHLASGQTGRSGNRIHRTALV